MRPSPVSRRVHAWRMKSGAALKELNGNQIHAQLQRRGSQPSAQKRLHSADNTNPRERQTVSPFPNSSADFRLSRIELRHWTRRWKGDDGRKCGMGVHCGLIPHSTISDLRSTGASNSCKFRRTTTGSTSSPER